MAKLKSHPDTQIDEIAPDIYRINTAINVPDVPGGFSFNQYLVKDDAPLVFHTGLRGLFPAVQAAIETVLPIRRLRYIAFSHFEADECGALNEFLAAAPESVPVCSAVGAMTSVNDQASRMASVMTDGMKLELGKHSLRWLDAPHLPHGWDCGYMVDDTTHTLFCGDVFTQPGSVTPALTEGDILEPSEMMRKGLDYFAHGKDTPALIEKLAATQPTTLACMHGSAWKGNGAALLRELAKRLG